MKIQVVESVLKAEESLAEANRRSLSEIGVLALNVVSAPGSGKTTLLERTLEALGPADRCAVLVGDLQTTRDAERLAPASADVVQINTGRGCHLSAAQVGDGLDRLTLEQISYLFIENVGNMVCPAGHDLGEHLRVALLSLPEGDDKVAKYPTLFQSADVVLLTKIDLMEVLDFDPERVRADLDQLNDRAPLLPLSSKSGEGMDAWWAWLERSRRELLDGSVARCA